MVIYFLAGMVLSAGAGLTLILDHPNRVHIFAAGLWVLSAVLLIVAFYYVWRVTEKVLAALAPQVPMQTEQHRPSLYEIN